MPEARAWLRHHGVTVCVTTDLFLALVMRSRSVSGLRTRRLFGIRFASRLRRCDIAGSSSGIRPGRNATRKRGGRSADRARKVIGNGSKFPSGALCLKSFGSEYKRGSDSLESGSPPVSWADSIRPNGASDISSAVSSFAAFAAPRWLLDETSSKVVLWMTLETA